MKKNFLSALILLGGVASAQNITDALRYSTEDIYGTARYRAMSGAFGALGGDISAINTNPAGSAVFAGSEADFSFGDTSHKNNTLFFGTKTENKTSDFNLGQFGVVFSIPNGQDSQWRKFSLGFNYQTTQNFNINNININGNSSNGLSDYFLHFATGIPQQNLMLDNYNNKVKVGEISLQDLYDEYGSARIYNPFNLRNALLGYTVGLISPESGNRSIDTSMSDAEADAILNEKNYVKNISNDAVIRHNFEVSTQGGIRKMNFNFGTQYSDNLYLGINLNSHSVNYKQITKHRETYANNTASFVTNSYFQNELETTGGGFSFQLGAIVKATESLRLGATYQSPTWYSLQERTTQYLQATTSNNGVFYANPQVIVEYPEYKLRTPGSWTASVAYIFGRNGLLSLDYIYKGYGNTAFRTDYLKPENDIIQNELTDANAIRLGGEYRIKAFSLRAGYRWEQSPYKNTKFIGDLNGYSFGAGYAFSGLRFDISYDIAQQNNKYQMYESVLNTPSDIKLNRRNLLFTISLKL